MPSGCTARGETENRIKEAQLDLFGRLASCHGFASNQLRLLLAALAYTLILDLRRLALVGTDLERAKTLKVDDARKKGTDLGPVVDEKQLAQDLKYIAIGNPKARSWSPAAKRPRGTPTARPATTMASSLVLPMALRA